MPAPVKRTDDGEPVWLQELCRLLSTGKSMVEACKVKGMPARSHVYEMMAEEEIVRTALARAREAQQEYRADEIIEIADQIKDCTDPVKVQAALVRIRTRQWLIPRLSARYSEKGGATAQAAIVINLHPGDEKM